MQKIHRNQQIAVLTIFLFSLCGLFTAGWMKQPIRSQRSEFIDPSIEESFHRTMENWN